MRKVDGLFLSPKSKKEVNYNDKTENPRPAPSRKGASRDAACTGTAYELSKLIPENFKGSLPSIDEIESELRKDTEG